MVSKPTRALINAASVVVLCWFAAVFYWGFTNAGLWRIVRDWFVTDYSEPSPAPVFAICALAGMIPVAAIGWVIWRLFLGGRPSST